MKWNRRLQGLIIFVSNFAVESPEQSVLKAGSARNF